MQIKIDDEIGAWGITAAMVTEQLNSASGDIEVILDSPGGDVFEGIQIHNAIKNYDGNVNIVINSVAASIASYIAMAGDKITAMSNSSLMIHNVWTVAAGDHNDLRKTADVAEGLTMLLSNAYAARTGKSREEILNLMNDETYYFGEDILSGGFADEIVKIDGNTEKMAAIADAKQRFSACMEKVKEHAEDQNIEKMAALIRKKEPETVISQDILAKRFKLITGETI